ncbi:DUF2089 family protein [Oceanobacillus chungangensis]|uniref:DUF2089 domain-containing protein n=1 Tax=Oceanobacillus chungangensis TaxID=1229152 RepID=A0A3D8PL07_9BACI|nr:DUF2089 family protein [Oceanobacillus chungangensis]RDW16167.1 hypothetical protein CWR45_14915 [Oceanobacillus chungangensis]
MNKDEIPAWILSLDNEDIEFIRKFVLSSGSLKQIAKGYGVSYPTVRIRLDRIIQKIEMNVDLEKEPLISYVKQLAIENRINLDDAKNIIEKYKSERMNNNE